MGTSKSLQLGDHPHHADEIEFSSDGSILATAGVAPDSGAHFWKTTDGRHLRADEDMTIAEFSPTAKTLAVLRKDGQLDVLSIQPDRPALLSLSPPASDSVRAVAIAPDDRRLAVSFTSGQIGIFDVTAETAPMRTFFGTQATALIFNPDGNQLAEGSDDGRVRLHALRGDEAPTEMRERHRGPVQRVAFNRDGRLLVSVATREQTRQLADLPRQWRDPRQRRRERRPPGLGRSQRHGAGAAARYQQQRC